MACPAAELVITRPIPTNPRLPARARQGKRGQGCREAPYPARRIVGSRRGNCEQVESALVDGLTGEPGRDRNALALRQGERFPAQSSPRPLLLGRPVG